jgi:hypothetical protein
MPFIKKADGWWFEDEHLAAGPFPTRNTAKAVVHHHLYGATNMPSRSGRFTLMKDRTDAELDQTITNAEQIGQAVGRACALMVNPFWEFCAGVDAYFERRRRKEERGKTNTTLGYANTIRALQQSLQQLETQQKEHQMKVTATITYSAEVDPNDYKDDDTGEPMAVEAILERLKGEVEDSGPEDQGFDFESVELSHLTDDGKTLTTVKASK